MCYVVVVFVCFFKQKTAYEMRISDWSSDVCSSDLLVYEGDRRFDVTVRVPEATRVNLDDIRSLPVLLPEEAGATRRQIPLAQVAQIRLTEGLNQISRENRSEEHTSELQSLMRISYAVFCLKKNKHTQHDSKQI